MKKIILFIFSFLIIILLMGCKQKYTIDQTLFIDSIGLDYNKETKKYSIYYHIASSKTLLTTQMGGGSSETVYSIGHVEAFGIYEGFDLIFKNSIKNVTLTHVQSMILTFDFINLENLNKLCTMLKTYDYIAPNFYVFATESKLSEIYSLQNPENISPFFSLITGNDFVTAYDLTYFTELVRSIYEKYIITKFIVIKSRDDIWQNNDEKITSVAPIGNLYINNDDQKLFLKNEDFKALSIINHEIFSTIVDNDTYYSIHNNNIIIKEKDKKFIIKVNGTFYTTNINVLNREEIRENFTKFIEDEFIKLINYSKEYNFDILNLENKLFRKSHFKDYEKTKSDFDYKATEIEFKINYKLLS